MTIEHKIKTTDKKAQVFRRSICLVAIGILLLGLFLFNFIFLGGTQKKTTMEDALHKGTLHDKSESETENESLPRNASQSDSVLFIGKDLENEPLHI